ncbi:iron chelate uptake ABC transporter family permease subunit [Klebsiella pneumoniae subsp. pneumoniae]|nr:iron chelate uptake ABC transporter family permease subunit [Klebsiella pneumoniae subsp. pneumoniae]
MLLGHSCFPEQTQSAPCCLDTRQRYQKRWLQNLRLPRSLVAVLIGAKPGARGHAAANPDPQPNGLSPSLLGINSGAALATGAYQRAESDAGCRLFPVVHPRRMRGGVSWLLVMTAGGGFHHTQDRNKLILAGIALSAFVWP